MTNPNGPYPGRQIFVGRTQQGSPCFAYLVTGRSPQSRQRRATSTDRGLIMGPIGNEPYDWLRHYTAVKTDDAIGLAVVTNGIQTEAIFEAYRLTYHTGSGPELECMTTLMTGAQYEPDSLHTPRVAGVIAPVPGAPDPVFILSIITDSPPAKAWRLDPEPGTVVGISTYQGSLDSPLAFAASGPLPVVELEGGSPAVIAQQVYRMSAATYQGDDVRVCAVGGVRADDRRTWEVSVINRHADPAR